MDTDSFIIRIKTQDISVDITKHIQETPDTSNYELDRPLPKAKEIINLMNQRWI